MVRRGSGVAVFGGLAILGILGYYFLTRRDPETPVSEQVREFVSETINGAPPQTEDDGPASEPQTTEIPSYIPPQIFGPGAPQGPAAPNPAAPNPAAPGGFTNPLDAFFRSSFSSRGPLFTNGQQNYIPDIGQNADIFYVNSPEGTRFRQSGNPSGLVFTVQNERTVRTPGPVDLSSLGPGPQTPAAQQRASDYLDRLRNQVINPIRPGGQIPAPSRVSTPTPTPRPVQGPTIPRGSTRNNFQGPTRPTVTPRPSTPPTASDFSNRLRGLDQFRRQSNTPRPTTPRPTTSRPITRQSGRRTFSGLFGG